MLQMESAKSSVISTYPQFGNMDKHLLQYSDHGGLLYSCFVDLWVNKDHQIDFLRLQDGEFINYTVMAGWYFPLGLASGEA